MYNSSIKGHWSQITTANIITNKKFELLQELPKCKTDMKWANAVGKNGANGLSQHRLLQTFNLLKKKSRYLQSAMKQNSVKWGMPRL